MIFMMLNLQLKKADHLKVENITYTYTNTSDSEFDLTDKNYKNKTYKQLVAFYGNGSSEPPLVNYTNNPIFQELTMEEDYFINSSNERLQVDSRDSKGYAAVLERLRRDDSILMLHVTLKNAATKKLKSRVFGY